MLMWLSFDSLASVSIEVHSHKYYSEGVLPESYKLSIYKDILECEVII